MDASTRLAATLIAVALVAYLLAIGAIAYSQPRPDAALMLARTCVSERSWRIDTADCAAIYEVALHRSTTHGTSLERALRDLSPRLHGTGPIRRPWLRHLSPDGSRPRGWPRGASWARRRPQWLATYQEATELVAGSTARVCSEPPVSWGSSADLARGRSMGRVWDGVDCGRTFNHFGRWR